MKVVLDSNVIVSAAINPKGIPAEIIRTWRAEAFTWITSAELLTELERVFWYQRVLLYRAWTDDQVMEFLLEAQQSAALVTPSDRLAIIRGPSDNRLLETAIAGEADYIVSGDRDLLSLGRNENVEIVTPARFAAILREASER